MTIPNSDPRKNPAMPAVPPKEPIRNALYYAAATIAVVLTGLIVGGIITLEQLTLIGATAGTVFALVFGLMERVRNLVNSPATSADNAAVRDALAQAIEQATQTGTVPPTGKRLAEQVIAGAVKGAATPVLQQKALALGIPYAIVMASTGPALQALMVVAEKTITELSKRAMTETEAEAALRAGRAG